MTSNETRHAEWLESIDNALNGDMNDSTRQELIELRQIVEQDLKVYQDATPTVVDRILELDKNSHTMNQTHEDLAIVHYNEALKLLENLDDCEEERQEIREKIALLRRRL